MPAEKIILKHFLSVGDVVMLTAAVRDIHRTYPGRFVTDVRTPFPDLWLENPYITPLDDNDPEVEVIDCRYPNVHTSNEIPRHFVHAFVDFLNERMGLQIKTGANSGDIHLSDSERCQEGIVEREIGSDLPYWLIVSGGKYDCTVKWWHHRRYQEVVDAFAGKVLFVQVGHKGHYHPPLAGVVDMRGRTDLRELIGLVHRSSGVVCPITALMHLAAAVPTPSDWKRLRPAVVIAGGREPVSWFSYPSHQVIHTIGALDCCATGGCWRSRTVALGDGEDIDKPERLCLDVVEGMPRCTEMIGSDEVCRRIALYHNDLSQGQWKLARPHLRRSSSISSAATADIPPTHSDATTRQKYA